MTLDITKPIETRDGHKVFIIKTNVGTTKQIIGTMVLENGSELAMIWATDGSVCGGWTNGYNLVNSPLKETRWVTLYSSISDNAMYSYLNENNSKVCAFSGQCGRLEIFYEDGIPVNVTLHKV